MCTLSVCPENTEYFLNINDVLTTGFLYVVAQIPVYFFLKLCATVSIRLSTDDKKDRFIVLHTH